MHIMRKASVGCAMGRVAALLVLLSVAERARAEAIPLFNGKDLSGWVNVNGAPDTWEVRDGMIVCSGAPCGFLRTTQMVRVHGPRVTVVQVPIGCGSIKADLAATGPQATPENASACRSSAR